MEATFNEKFQSQQYCVIHSFFCLYSFCLSNCSFPRCRALGLTVFLYTSAGTHEGKSWKKRAALALKHSILGSYFVPPHVNVIFWHCKDLAL